MKPPKHKPEADTVAKTFPKIVAAIENFYEANGYQPNVREVGQAIGLSSSDSIHKALTQMRAAGLIDWVDDTPRTLHVVRWRVAA